MNDREWGIQDRLINRAYDKCEEEKKKKERSQDRDEVVGRKVVQGKTAEPARDRGTHLVGTYRFLAPSRGFGGALPSIKKFDVNICDQPFLLSYQTSQPQLPPRFSASRRSSSSRLLARRDGFSDGSTCSTNTTLQLDTGLKPFSLHQSVHCPLGLADCFSRLAFSLSLSCSQRPKKTARTLVLTPTNCLPLCSLYAQDGQLFIIVHVEEQNQGLDNPSNPPCCCRSKCNSRTNADRHPFSITRRETGLGRNEDQGEERLFTHDSASLGHSDVLLRRRRP